MARNLGTSAGTKAGNRMAVPAFRPNVAALFPLIQRIAAQETRAFRRHRLEAEDVAQDCACRLQEGLTETDRTGLEAGGGAWLRLLVRHRVWQQAARQSARAAATPLGRRGAFVGEFEAVSDEPTALDFRQLHCVASAVLPPEVDVVVLLLTLDQPVAEVARLLSLPQAVVRGRAQHAGALLAKDRGSTGVRLPIVGPATLAEFLVRGRLAGRTCVDLAHAAGIRCSTARSIVKRVNNRASPESADSCNASTPLTG
jgi:DNA-directed RNA polymerase specialized sigma24 family protein